MASPESGNRMTNERAYTPSLVLHVLRNPHGWSAEAITAARLQAADEIERLKKREKDLMDVIDSRDRALGFVPLDEVHASEPCDGPHRAFLEMPEGYSGPVKVSNPGAAVAEVTVYPSPQGASRDADHCDYPDCEHHWELVVDWALAAMKKLHESAEPDTDHPEIPAIIPAAAFRAFVDEHARLMRIRASAPQGASRDASPETYNERVAGVKVMDASYPEGHYLRYGRGPGQLAGCGNWMPKHGVGPYCGNCGFHADEHCRSSRT